MEPIPQLGTVIAVVVGTVFSALGVLGYIRMPDVYTRLHATGKVGVFGVVILLVAAVLWTPLGFGKALVLILFLLIAGPATSHAMASAAYRIGIPLAQATRDDLGTASEVAASQNMRLRREDAPSS
jgi:multicomponent Na+:H+ antiporter subunit G